VVGLGEAVGASVTQGDVMALGSRPRLCATAALSLACAALLASCGSSGKSTTASSSTPTSASTEGTPGTSAPSASTTLATSAPAGAPAHTPASCSAIPVSVISPYTGGVATSRAFPAPGHSVSCEFANANASSIVIVNIGQGSAAAFATLRAASGGGGRTITPVPGIGSTAFSVSNGGLVRGLSVLTPQNAMYTVTTSLTLARDEALVRQLMALR
jgi:hypothetical protein